MFFDFELGILHIFLFFTGRNFVQIVSRTRARVKSPACWVEYFLYLSAIVAKGKVAEDVSPERDPSHQIPANVKQTGISTFRVKFIS